MPSKSKAQENLMAAAAHDAEFAKEAGIPQSVAEEFFAADQAKKGRDRLAAAMMRQKPAR